MMLSTVQQAITAACGRYFSVTPQQATPQQLYQAVASVVRQMLAEKYNTFSQAVRRQEAKEVFYFSMEFLLGRSLKNNLHNLQAAQLFEAALADWGRSLDALYDQEPDAGLGNGGLGRLAACYLDALATQRLPACGFSILYEYGLFRQKIVEGWQTELPDIWLPGGEVWLQPRTDQTFTVRFGGQLKEYWDADGHLHAELTDCQEVEAVPYDMLISGADSPAVSRLRLWRARDRRAFDMGSFTSGDYARATLQANQAELICKVLYPNDSHAQGRTLRLQQQYFLVSASLQYITQRHFARYGGFEQFAQKVALHINDTHPALCIPELMRIFLDDYHMPWDQAQRIVHDAVAYTNHTVMAEALETWPESLLAAQLPRIYSLLCEINRRFCDTAWQRAPGSWDAIERMAVLSHGQVRMANLCIAGGHKVNGVSRMHTGILCDRVFADFYRLWPEKFINVTNGIAHRRWLCQANPRLSELITQCIGPGFYTDASQLAGLAQFADDPAVLEKLAAVKRANKQQLAGLIADRTGVQVDPAAIFDVQVKRLHEYKRQLLNALHIITLYHRLKDDPNANLPPRVFIFGAKAAPGYHMAKQIISLLVHLADHINRDPAVKGRLAVVFLENYSVTLAEALMPAAEVSQQISLAGKEASGTGNMKMMLNGAITLGTPDGANVEIAQAVGADNIFLFGHDDREVEQIWQQGYNATYYYQRNPALRAAVDALQTGFNGHPMPQLAHYLLVGDHGVADPYLCLADFDAYAAAQQNLAEAYADPAGWHKKSLYNIAAAGAFAADRAIDQYAREIWGLSAVTPP